VDIAVQSGVTLTINPGVTVILGPNADVNVLGAIVANGTVEKPIRVGGTSETTRGGIITLSSSMTTEFKYCHFTHMAQIKATVPEPGPHGNHLLQHSVFRDFSSQVIRLEQTPARILDNIFRANNGQWCVVLDYHSSFTDETTPQIWYNVFDQNGFLFEEIPSGTVDLENRPFFKSNRVAGGKGLHFDVYTGGTASRGHLSNITITDCDLIACSQSIRFDGFSSSGYYHCLNKTVTGCSLNNIVGNDADYSIVHYTGNYWGTDDLVEINARIEGLDAGSSVAAPFSATSLFPQADVDQSDSSNSTAQNDADMVKQSLVGLVTLTPTQRDIADVDGSGDVDIRDALIIESFVHGMIWKLPDRP